MLYGRSVGTYVLLSQVLDALYLHMIRYVLQLYMCRDCTRGDVCPHRWVYLGMSGRSKDLTR